MAKNGTKRRGANKTFAEAQTRQAAERAATVQAARDAERAARQAEADQAATAVHAAERLRELCSQYSFYTVQRLESRDTEYDDPKRGVTRFFDPDYMGNSNYEWGALGESFRRILAAGEPAIMPVELTRKGVTRTVYFVGATKDFADKLAAFKVWLGQDHLRCEEWTNFDYAFAGSNPWGWEIRTDAWWSFDCDLTWTLKPELADKLLAGFKVLMSK
jgi:hypothetical protein